MHTASFKQHTFFTNLWMRWWIFWLGYALVPSLVMQAVGQFLPDPSFGLLSIRMAVLLSAYFLLPTAQRLLFNQSLLQPLSGKGMGQVLGVFLGVLLLGLGFFTGVESFFQVVQSPLVESHALCVVSSYQMIAIALLAPIVEETWFRHWLLGQPAKGNQSPWLGVVYGWQDAATVAVFGLLHFSADYEGLKSVVWASVMGLFFLWVRRYTGSLTACMGLHALHNSLLLLL